MAEHKQLVVFQLNLKPSNSWYYYEMSWKKQYSNPCDKVIIFEREKTSKDWFESKKVDYQKTEEF